MNPENERIAQLISKRKNRLLDKMDIKSLLLRFIIAGTAAYLIFTQVFLFKQVRGMDMFPSLKDGDLALVFKLQQSYSKNDLVAYQTAEGTRFGRIVAKSGDVVYLDDSGTLIVNGTVQGGDILYPSYALPGIEYPYRVPDECLFVLGDYRTKATDSRRLGPITLSTLHGKVITILRRRGL